MNPDERCCGTGTCLINADGVCWCGQHWNGTAMCRPAPPGRPDASELTAQPSPVSRAPQGNAS